MERHTKRREFSTPGNEPPNPAAVRGAGLKKPQRRKKFRTGGLKPKGPKLDRISPGQGIRSGAGTGGLSGALLVPMLLNGGYGYAQL